MDKSIEKTKEQIIRFKNKYSAYEEILNFYENILDEQLISTEISISTIPQKTSGHADKLQIEEGFPLIDKKDFILNIPSSIKLFESICKIGKSATEKMKENIYAIENAIRINALPLKELLSKYYDEFYINEIATEFDIDKTILKFLIYKSIQPSIHANVEKVRDQVDLKNWLRGYCPICGSLPQMSELKGEGQRYLLCSFCDFIWLGERLKCPFCENNDHEKLHYFYAEGEETYRVDLCDNCKQYIKTVDSRKLDYEPDLTLEDIVTIHLDILANEKGFKRPIPNVFGI